MTPPNVRTLKNARHTHAHNDRQHLKEAAVCQGLTHDGFAQQVLHDCGACDGTKINTPTHRHAYNRGRHLTYACEEVTPRRALHCGHQRVDVVVLKGREPVNPVVVTLTTTTIPRRKDVHVVALGGGSPTARRRRRPRLIQRLLDAPQDDLVLGQEARRCQRSVLREVALWPSHDHGEEEARQAGTAMGGWVSHVGVGRWGRARAQTL